MMQTEEPVSAIEETGIIVKILDSTYERANIEKFESSITQLNTEEQKLLLRLTNEFEDFLDETI